MILTNRSGLIYRLELSSGEPVREHFFWIPKFKSIFVVSWRLYVACNTYTILLPKSVHQLQLILIWFGDYHWEVLERVWASVVKPGEKSWPAVLENRSGPIYCHELSKHIVVMVNLSESLSSIFFVSCRLHVSCRNLLLSGSAQKLPLFGDYNLVFFSKGILATVVQPVDEP